MLALPGMPAAKGRPLATGVYGGSGLRIMAASGGTDAGVLTRLYIINRYRSFGAMVGLRARSSRDASACVAAFLDAVWVLCANVGSLGSIL